MQVLHDELIKIDLKHYYINSIKDLALIFALILPMLLLLILAFADQDIWLTYYYVVLTLFCVGIFSWVGYYIKKIADANKGNFKVDTDHLINGDGLVGTVGAIDADFLVNPRYTWISLCFGKHKPFKFKKRNVFYKWSEAYKMDGYSLLNSSAPGDKFYIVTLGGKTPRIVYNAKMFDYKAEQEQDL